MSLTRTPLRTATALVATALAGATAVALAPVASAAATDDVVAVTGTNNVLYVQGGGAGFTDRGGDLVDAPAIARVGNVMYYVGVTRSHGLVVRTDATAFAGLSPAGAYCSGISAAGVGTKLYVSCRGGNNQLYVGSAETAGLAAGALPTIGSFAGYGGKLLYGTEIISDAAQGTADVFVVGTNHQVYVTDTAHRGRFSLNDGVLCYGTLALDRQYADGGTTDRGAACADVKGALQVLRDAGGDQDAPFMSIGGRIVGRPAVSVDPDGTTRYYVVGGESRLYRASKSAADAVTGFSRIAGRGLYGLAAVNTTPPPAPSGAALARSSGTSSLTRLAFIR